METINLILPTCWQELTPKQLRYVYTLISEGCTSSELKTYCMCRFGEMEIVCPYGDGYQVRFQNNLHHITALQVAEVLSMLDWLDDLPAFPVRLAEISKAKAVSADLQGVSFEHYIMLDNLYQGYLATQDAAIIHKMAAILYSQEVKLQPEEVVSIFYWFAAVKKYFARLFNHFFVAGEGQPATEQGSMFQILQEQMNTQIRALTRGDITKEERVLQMDVWRALTELDAQAKEYEEMRKQVKK